MIPSQIGPRDIYRVVILSKIEPGDIYRVVTPLKASLLDMLPCRPDTTQRDALFPSPHPMPRQPSHAPISSTNHHAAQAMLQHEGADIPHGNAAHEGVHRGWRVVLGLCIHRGWRVVLFYIFNQHTVEASGARSIYLNDTAHRLARWTPKSQ